MSLKSLHKFLNGHRYIRLHSEFVEAKEIPEAFHKFTVAAISFVYRLPEGRRYLVHFKGRDQRLRYELCPLDLADQRSLNILNAIAVPYPDSLLYIFQDEGSLFVTSANSYDRAVLKIQSSRILNKMDVGSLSYMSGGDDMPVIAVRMRKC